MTREDMRNKRESDLTKRVSELEEQNAELLRVLRIVENYARFPGQSFSWDDVRATVFNVVQKAGVK